MTSEVEIHTPIVSRFKLDGGAMFGVVPRTMWQRVAPPDELGRIEMVARVIVAIFRESGRIAVIDSGMGTAWSQSELERYGMEHGQPGLVDALAGLGLAPSDVTDAVMTHLHFDHAGGWVVERGSGGLEPVLPRARHHVQRAHLAWAKAPSPRDRGSFRADVIEALERGGLLQTVGPDADLFAGLSVVTCGGHTPGMQLALVEGPAGAVLYPSDLIPTAAHVRVAWNMAYDLEPLHTLREKVSILERARRRGWFLVLGHDPSIEAARVTERGGELTLEPCACPKRL